MENRKNVVVIGVRGDGNQENVCLDNIRNVTHTNDGFVIIVYIDGKHRLYRNFIIV